MMWYESRVREPHDDEKTKLLTAYNQRVTRVPAASAAMIPPFNDHGYLPPGIHKASLDETVNRFGSQSEIRRDQTESLQWLAGLLRRLDVKRLILNGSFVTDEAEPNDVDCLVLVDLDSPRGAEAAAELRAGLPFLTIDVGDQDNFDFFVEQFFATDRKHVPKGMIEVIL